MTSARPYRSNLASFNELIHEVMGGEMRRHVFTQWELELLLDLQTCRVRKSARVGLLRRYLKAVQQHFAHGATVPLRLSSFLAGEHERNPSSTGSAPNQACEAHLSAGISSR